MYAISEAESNRISKEYWDKGYVVVRSVFTASDIDSAKSDLERLWNLPGLSDDLNLRSEFRRNSDGQWVMDRLDPVLDLSEPLVRLAMHGRLREVLEQVLGGPPQVLKCKLIRKDPGTGGYAAHQDFLYWRWLQMQPNSLCSVAIPIFDADATAGGIEFFPGMHGSLLPSSGGDPDKDFDPTLISTRASEIPDVRAGDVLIFHSLAPHRSGLNHAQRSRTLLLPSYAVSLDTELYTKYYEREIRRRCADLVGFERMPALSPRWILEKGRSRF